MVFAGLATNSFGYRVLVLLHISTAIVGFGSSFVWPVLSAKAKRLTPVERYRVNAIGMQISKPMTINMVFAVLVSGLVLTAVATPWEFSQPWVWSAIVMTSVIVVISGFAQGPNTNAMVDLQRRLAGIEDPRPRAGAGDVGDAVDDPATLEAELEHRKKRDGMYGGITHMLFLLIMIDMVWKPWL